jgi:hypothetical protein
VLGLQLWQGVGAIIGVLSLILGLVAYCGSSGGSGTTSSVEINSAKNGICIVQGSGNKVECVPPAGTASLGDISVTWPTSLGGEYVYLGDPSQLPKPPDYPAEYKASHCDKWLDWTQRQPTIYSVGADAFMDIISGSPDLVIVKNVKVNLFRKMALPHTVTLIRCKYGGGGAGPVITTNVITGQTEVEDDRTSKRFAMPPGSLSIAGADFEVARISIISRQNYLYEGSIEVDTLVNGKPRKVEIGSVSEPVKWVELSSNKRRDVSGAYDWDVQKHAWVKGFNPLGDQLSGS